MKLNPAVYDDLIRMVLALDQSLDILVPGTKQLGIASPVDSEWYSLLKQKLVPQLSRRSHLIVSIMGGTNTGKSVIFNLLAGEKISATESFAAGTKHPVALIPEKTDPESVLPHYFQQFEQLPWKSADDPVQQSSVDRLFWKCGKNVPEKLILLDTPDVDSDVEVNWDRARQIRQLSDVIIGVLTSQKYNDAAIKRFFREAAQAGKPIILIWNMAFGESPADVWSTWISQFCHETDAKPLAVFVTPHDLTATETLTLPFYDIGPNGKTAPTEISLRDYLNHFRFDDLKLQALLGALRRINAPDSGLGDYLRTIEKTTSLFGEAAKTFRGREHLNVAWPSIPKTLLAEEVGHWCNTKRSNLLQNVSAVYGTVLYPVQKLWGNLRDRFRSKQQIAEQQEELTAVFGLVEKTIEQLKNLLEKTDNPILRQELDQLLGEKRKILRDKSEKIHTSLPPKTDERIRQEVFVILNQWIIDHPKQWQILHKVDTISLGTHAVLSSGAVLTFGVFGAGALLGTSGAVPYLLMTGGLLGGSEALLKILGDEVRLAIAELKVAIQKQYAKWRKEIFLERFELELWSDLLQKFETNAGIVEMESFQETRRIAQKIQKVLYDTENF